ncbi:MAG TPA: hypothetical protein VFR23_23635 [Jiangellaceae bacterium]|nr:hypothetical protein [Jiangellaceae bacterium]
MSSLLAAGLIGVLAVGSAAGGEFLAAGVLIAQVVFVMGAVRVAPVPAASGAAWLALLVGAGATAWTAWAGLPGLSPVAIVLGPALVLAIVLQLVRRDGRPRLTASLTLAVSACVLVVLPVAWVGLRYADGGGHAVALGLLGAGIAVLADALRVSAMLRRLLGVLVAAALAAGLVVWLETFSLVPAVSAVVVAAFGAVMAIVALAAVDVLADESRRSQGQPHAVGYTRDVAVAMTPLRVVMPVVVAAPVVYVLGRILVEYASR